MTTTDHDPAPTDTATPQKKRLSNLRVRVITSLVLLPVVIGAAAVGGVWWAALAALVCALAMSELTALLYPARWGVHTVIALAMGQALLWSAYLQPGVDGLTWAGVALAAVGAAALVEGQARAGARAAAQAALRMGFACLYVGIPAALAVELRLAEAGIAWVALALALATGTDTFAYFGGSLLGRRPLAPRLSPRKTVEGAVIGALGGSALAAVVMAMTGQLSPVTLVIVVLGPGVAIAGDLFESALKRHFDVKDSHLGRWNIIPGHGGVLDRVDSTLFIAPLIYVVLRLGGVL